MATPLPPRRTHIRRMISLQPDDYNIIRRVMDEKGFGSKGFSAALRFIIRDWDATEEMDRLLERLFAEAGFVKVLSETFPPSE